MIFRNHNNMQISRNMSYYYRKQLCCFIFLCKAWSLYIFHDFLMNRKYKRTFWNFINVFTVTFDQSNASLLNKSSNFFQKLNIFNSSVGCTLHVSRFTHSQMNRKLRRETTLQPITSRQRWLHIFTIFKPALFAHSWGFRWKDSSVAVLHTKTVLLEELYTLPKTHFMEQLTRSKHPITNTVLTQQLTHIHRNQQTLHFLVFLLAWKYFHVSKYKAKVMKLWVNHALLSYWKKWNH